MKKKLFILFTFILFCSISVFSQKLFVEKTDSGYEQPIVNKLIYENYNITFKQDSADYIIKCIIGKTGMGRAKGSVVIIDNKSGDLIGITKEAKGQTSIGNGYANPKMLAMKKIAKKYLIPLLKTKKIKPNNNH